MTVKFIPYKPRLQVYILVHPDSDFKLDLPNNIYSFLTRDIKDPLSRGLGIPVFFWNPFQKSDNKIFNSIDFNNAHHTVVISLIDYKMVNDSDWSEYINQIWNRIKNNYVQHRLIPVALDNTALNIDGEVQKANFLQFFKFPEDKRIQLLRIQLTHELCRLLKGDLDPNLFNKLSLPINLFLSHAKIDGESHIIKVRDFINKETSINSFFYAIDIPPGLEFERIIEENIANACLLIFQTDKFASREWCRREVLIAKKKKCPIIVINCLVDGVDRSFPYMGNVPIIRWNIEDKNRIIDILTLALQEMLRYLYNAQHLKDFYNVWKISDKNLKCFRAPEILTCIQFLNDNQIKSNNIFIYPDPPLGIEEHILLKKTLTNVQFMTPTQFIKKKISKITNQKSRKIIGLSISKSPELPRKGLAPHHLTDAMVEFTRYVLASKTSIAYGGDLRENGFTKILFDLARKHTKSDEEPRTRILNFLSWPYYRKLSEKDQAELIRVADIKKIDLPDDLKKFSEKEIDVQKPEDKYLVARALTKMRSEMNKFIDCRIFFGGNTTEFQGKYPGLIEEAYLTLKAKKPIYLIGSFGGASHAIIEAIKGEIPEILTIEKHLQKSDYKAFVEYYNQKVLQNSSIIEEIIDYDKILKFFHKIGIDGLKNGLTEAENYQLFKTPYIFEMISLVLKGLSRIKII